MYKLAINPHLLIPALFALRFCCCLEHVLHHFLSVRVFCFWFFVLFLLFCCFVFFCAHMRAKKKPKPKTKQRDSEPEAAGVKTTPFQTVKSVGGGGGWDEQMYFVIVSDR